MRKNFTFGTPTLLKMGGDQPRLTPADWYTQVVRPDFEGRSQIGGSRFTAISPNLLGFKLQPGNAWWLHSAPIDPMGWSTQPELFPIEGQFFEFSPDSAWGETNGVLWDYRTGIYKFGVWLRTSNLPVGVRTVTLVATCHSRNYSFNVIEPIWSAEVRAAPEGANVLFLESQNTILNLLQLRRKWWFRGHTESSGGADTTAGCWLGLSFNLYHTAPTDIDIIESRVWLKKVGELYPQDPEFGLPMETPTAYTVVPGIGTNSPTQGSITIRGSSFPINLDLQIGG